MLASAQAPSIAGLRGLRAVLLNVPVGHLALPDPPSGRVEIQAGSGVPAASTPVIAAVAVSSTNCANGTGRPKR